MIQREETLFLSLVKTAFVTVDNFSAQFSTVVDSGPLIYSKVSRKVLYCMFVYFGSSRFYRWCTFTAMVQIVAHADQPASSFIQYSIAFIFKNAIVAAGNKIVKQLYIQ